MNDLISVIIPVYKTEQYLEKCVRSVMAQTYAHLDVILIDDGSPDNSGAICDKLAAEDARIQVLHTENQGVSKARYDALQHAKGEYVTFVDSDDYVAPDYVACLYDAIHEFSADAATCAHCEVNEAGDITKNNVFAFSDGNFCLSVKTTFEWIYYLKKCSTSLWCKLFRTAIMKEIPPATLSLGEDSYICQRYFFRCNKIAYTGKVQYFYLQRGTSAIHSYADVRFYDYVRLYDMLAEEFYTVCPQAAAAYNNKLVENNFVVFLRLHGAAELDKEKMRHMEENIKKYRWQIMRDPGAEKRTRLACLLSYGGMNTVAAGYKIFDRIKKFL